jgi:xanthosine utilization system XapX-like protein
MTPSIKNPCPEKWEGMTPDEQGRFCGKCSKIVIDFTKKTTQEIIDFLTERKGEDICGKLRKPALIPVRSPAEPALSLSNVLGLTRGRIKTFLAALYLAFGSMLFTSCGPTEDDEPVGKVALDSADAAENQHYLDSMMQADSLAKSQAMKDTSGIDSAEMMNTLNVLDSVMKSKNK